MGNDTKYDDLYGQISSKESRRAADKLFEATAEELADSFQPEGEEDERRKIGVSDITRKAIEVFGDKEKAEAWILEPCHALGGQRPADMLDTVNGQRQVEEILVGIEHGLFS